MNDTVFRQYDIRGKVGSDLNIDQAYDCARALAYYFVQKNSQVKTVVVGMDGRTHSPAFKEQICAGLIDSGLDVQFVGVCTSPVVYFLMHTQSVQAGLMITASHNGKEYNGIKICLGTHAVWGDQIQEIKNLFNDKRFIETNRTGVVTTIAGVDLYVAWLANHFNHLKNMSLSAIVDCGNGAAGAVLPALVRAMHWSNVTLLYSEVDGSYPHHDADPTKEENMLDVRRLLASTDAAIGVGLDGDADRMGAMTKDGYLIPGDKLLALLSKPIVTGNPGSTVVFDITCSGGLGDILKQWGAIPCMCPTGSSYIKAYMKKTGALFGGEVSCHFFFADRYFGYDDGIYAMMRLFELLQESGLSLSELVAEFPVRYSSPNIRIPCAEQDKATVIAAVQLFFVDNPNAETVTVDGVRVSLPEGWGLVRASNTEPKLSIRFESDSAYGLEQVKEQFVQVLRNYFDETTLKTYIG